MEKAQLLFTIFFCAVLIMFLNYLVCTIFSCIYNIESMAKTQLRLTIFLCAMLFLFLNYLAIKNWSSLFSRVYPSGIKGMKEVTPGKPNAQDIQLIRQKSKINQTGYNITITDPAPLIVIGILSNSHYKCLRDSQRNTLVRAAKAYTMLNIKIVFLLDHTTPSLSQEQKIYNDIVYLNTTELGWNVRFANKLYIWYSYAAQHFPDAILIGRMDDDVFVCTPQIFDRLNKVKNKLLHYGYGIGDGYIDDMFLFVGIDLAKRIVSRPVCDSQIAKVCFEEEKNAVRWIRKRFSVYHDVVRVDESKTGKMIHFYARGPEGQRQMKNNYAKYKENFCATHLLFHKATPEYMVEFDKSNVQHGNDTAKRQLSDEEIQTMYNCTVHNF